MKKVSAKRSVGVSAIPVSPTLRLSDTASSLITFRPYQREIFDEDESGVLIAHWSRQIGKSYVLAAGAVMLKLFGPLPPK